MSKAIIIALFLSGSVHAAGFAGVHVVRIQLAHYGAQLPEQNYLKLATLMPRTKVNQPTEHLASLTNSVLQHWALTAEAHEMLHTYFSTPISTADTLVLVKGRSVDAVVFAPDNILALCKKESTLDMMRMVLRLYGIWCKMDTHQRAGLKGMLDQED